MSRKLILREVLKQVVDTAQNQFPTRDISEADIVRRAHPTLSGHRNYHAFVGGGLSDHRDYLNIREVRKRTARGSVWEKLPPKTSP